MLSSVTAPDASGSAKEFVLSTLHTAICYGELRPGQELVQEVIAKELGVSRSPIREAFYELQAEGLVDYVLNRGFFVKKTNIDFWRDYYWVRIQFEEKALRSLCEAEVDGKPFILLSREEKLAFESNDIRGLSKLNNRFEALVEESLSQIGLGRLSNFLKQLHKFAPRRISEDSSERDIFVRQTYDYHQRSYQAIAEHNADLAVSLMKEYLKKVETRYLNYRKVNGLDD